jgi:hypothetical protein
MELATTGGRGPQPSFTRAHFLLAFLTIGNGGIIGRQALAIESGLGEGSVRTVLKKLREEGYAEVIASGSRLTASGRVVYSRLRKKLSSIVMLDGSQLTVGKRQSAVGVRGGAGRVQSGIQQRDSAIMVGAAGATTYAIRHAKFTIPGGSADCERDFPSPVWRVLKKEIAPRDGDAVVLSGADDDLKAKLGALSAALTLL